MRDKCIRWLWQEIGTLWRESLGLEGLGLIVEPPCEWTWESSLCTDCGQLRGINELSRTHKEQMWRLLSRTQGRFRGDGEDPSGQVAGSIAQTEGTNKEWEAGK